jgi:broad specificity phosphatase PhoE
MHALLPFLAFARGVPRTELYEIGVLALLLVAAIMRGMRTRRFYIVRHGQTLLNAAHIKQGADGALSPHGREQVAQVAQRLLPLRIQNILSSPYPRAVETALILKGVLHARVRTTQLLSERRNASFAIGKPTDDPDVLHAGDVIDLSYHDDDFRFADEENFLDMKKRARACLRYLARHGASRTCVVTHHAFLKMLLAYMQFGKDLHEPAFVTLSFLNTSDNGGISVCEYRPWQRLSGKGGWTVVSYNEQVNA